MAHPAIRCQGPADLVIGILGGTFDPVHFGHLRPALEVCEGLTLDELRLIPAHVPPHRAAPVTGARHRLAMVELAVAGTPCLGADSRELDRPGPSYSVDTLWELRAEIGHERPLLMVLGMDAFESLPTWHRWREIPELAHVVVAHRPGAEMPEGRHGYLAIADAVTAPENLRAHPAGQVYFHSVSQLDISATGVRACLRAGHDARFLLPDVVLDYIREHGLYQNDPE